MIKAILFFVLFIPSLSFSKDDTYSCKFLKHYDTTFDYPQNITIKINFQDQILISYIEDNQDLTDSYFCKNCSSPSSRIDIWTIRYDPWSLDQTHFQNARVFEIYAEDLVGHLWRPAQNGVDYQCKIS